MSEESENILTTFEELQNLKNVGLYGRLMKKGIISLSVNLQFEIHNYFQVQLITNQEHSDSKSRAYQETEAAFNCCEMTVRRANTAMKL